MTTRYGQKAMALGFVLTLLLVACGEPQVVEDGDDDAADPGGETLADDAAPEDGDEDEEVEIEEAPDGGLAMWSRAGDVGQFSEYLVEQWNETHDAQIAITIIPNDQYITRTGTAAAAGELPDLLGVDLIYMPDFNSAGLMMDVTDRVQAMSFADSLSPAHMDLGEWGGAHHSVPLSIDTSGMVYDKDLFEEAGLDPESPPSSLEEVEEAAKAISDLGDDVYGLYFAGACGGCFIFTYTPTIWAQDGDILTDDDPPQATFDSPEVEESLTWLKGMWEQGLVPEGAIGDDGATWLSTFMAEDIGIMFCGSFCPSAFASDAPDLNYGVGFIPGPDGGESSFAGGDVVGISRDAQDPDLAWEFIEWMLSEEVQLEHFAAQGQLVSRTDLADNEHADDITGLFNEATAIGQTPKTLGFNEMINDPNGPWLEMWQTAVFEGDVEGAMAEAQERAQGIIDLAQ